MFVNTALEKISVGSRLRREAGDIEKLAASIAQLGLLHPIVCTRDGTLIAGERRLMAVKSLGWATVPVHVVDLESILRGEFEAAVSELAKSGSFNPRRLGKFEYALSQME